MTIEQPDVIDVIGTNVTTGAVHLTVADHLEWNRDHMIKLQEKLNRYLAFVESGEIYSAYPDAVGKKILFDLVLKHRPHDEAIKFLKQIGAVIEQGGFLFRYGPHPAGYEHDNA
jgi:hypothetical protein